MTGPTNEGRSELAELFGARRFPELEQAARRAAAAHPGDAFAWSALGVACAALGKHDDALHACRRAVELLPLDAEAHANLASVLQAVGRLDDARQSFRRALEIDPGFERASLGLGSVLTAQGKYEEAAECAAALARRHPASADHLNHWGIALHRAGRLHESRKACEAALACNPGHAEALSNLANTLAELGLPTQAEPLYREALRQSPRQAAIHNNLGKLLMEQGRLGEAHDAWVTALELNPDLDSARSNLLLALNYDASVDPVQARDTAVHFASRIEARARTRLAHEPLPRGNRALRVGFVSADLRNHPVGYFIESFVRHVQASEMQLHAYPTVALEDELTSRIKPNFAGWRCIGALADEAAARAIHADGIDVLVDLCGHTANNRLGVFAWKPAPVQATWLGYFTTTGLSTIDWLIADRVGVPAETQSRFVERIAWLPETRLCFEAPADAPPVAVLPALRAGHLTFGSFQNLGKIGDDVLRLWARVLALVPRSRLRLQNAQLADPAMQQRFVERLQRHGISPGVVALHAHSPRPQYLAAHAEVDILLDTFPYPGGTTTCEALWMGVPTLTLCGDSMLARQGASLLGAAGLANWIARGEDDYVKLAAAFASDLPALAELRAGMREHLVRTPLFDGRKFAKDFTALMCALSNAGSREA